MSKLLDDQLEKTIAREYTKNKKTQEEIAQIYGLAPVTIRRALAEQGVLKLKNYSTRKDMAFIETLERYGVTDAKELEEVLKDAGYRRSLKSKK